MAYVLSCLAGSDDRGSMTYHLLGLILILLGFFHMFDEINPLEVYLVQFVQQISKNKSLLFFFKEVWFFGRTSFSVLLLVFLICINWKTGLITTGVFLVFVGIEYLLKTLYFRKRPYAAHHEIAMLQPLEPSDSSFPSGDTMRVWYLALIISASAGDSVFFLGAIISLAILVTLGRLVMGVHYLTDTLTGAGLGILEAGTTIWLWNLLKIL